MAPRIDATAFLPLTERDFHILLSLAHAECHGYGLVKLIAARTAGALELDPAYLYRSIQRLIDLDLVAESARRPAPDSARVRRYFAITDLGREVLDADAARMRDLASAVESVARSESRGR